MRSNYRQINDITGWLVFGIAAATYLLSMESTASLWDCGEFIASAFKLEVGHPPGAPVFMLLGRFFTLFAGGDVTKAALMANSLSALASAFTILFLFWSVTHLARKMVLAHSDDYTLSNIIAVMSAGVVGALAYTFSDTFWFSAVEGEVYATSSLFTAIVFWLILRWEDSADKPHAARWLILIAYLMGLSLGVHLLNLLVIPAIVLTYYFKKYEVTTKGIILSLLVSLLLLILIMYGIIPGVLTIASRFELLFINGLGMPYNSGVYIFIVLLALFLILAVRYSMLKVDRLKLTVFSAGAVFLSGMWLLSDSSLLNLLVLAGITYLIWVSALKHRVILNTFLTALLVIMLGYSSFALIMIRANANPPMNQNDPSNIFSLMYYLNREQYGQRPLFHGQYYNAPVTDIDTEGKPTYNPVDGRYKITSRGISRVYDERFLTVFPRMYSDNPGHVSIYEQWGKVKGVPVSVADPSSGERRTIRKPRFIENLRFMFTYQINHMYTRYLLWNFVGRQNDNQNVDGNAVDGNAITGIESVDRVFVGSSANMPDDIKNHPSRNRYFALPLLLGLIGLIYQLTRDVRNWWVVLMLFIMTGVAIIIYLNQAPVQPRERDYAYAGSFYAFAIWIGMGVLMLYDLFSTFMSRKIAAPLAGIICLLSVPVLMASENWHDHDRSGLYLTRDVASNYLNSCAPGAILFTNGDNDTFPLWYAQEVEGLRTDVRVCNLMLMNTDWYINQMKYKAYGSEPLPLSIPKHKYYDGINNQVYIVERINEPVSVKQVVEFFSSDESASKIRVSATEEYDFIPTRTIRVPVDKDKVLASGVVSYDDAHLIVPYIDIELQGSAILKNQMMILDILANNDWERPLYFVAGYHDDALGLEEYFQLEGIAYRFVPVKSENKGWLEYGRIDTDIMYENVMDKFLWRGAKDEDVYIDNFHRRTLTVIRARNNYARLATALAQEGDTVRGKEVLDRCLEELPFSKLPHDMYTSGLVSALFEVGDKQRAVEISIEGMEQFLGKAEYYLSQRMAIVASAEYEIQSALQYASRIADACSENGAEEEISDLNETLERLYSAFMLMRREYRGNG